MSCTFAEKKSNAFLCFFRVALGLLLVTSLTSLQVRADDSGKPLIMRLLSPSIRAPLYDFCADGTLECHGDMQIAGRGRRFKLNPLKQPMIGFKIKFA